MPDITITLTDDQVAGAELRRDIDDHRILPAGGRQADLDQYRASEAEEIRCNW